MPSPAGTARGTHGANKMSVRKRILIVDDDKQVLFVLDRILSRIDKKYEITTARNGREALKNATETRFDLLITDLRMPDIGGVALTKAITALNTSTTVMEIIPETGHSAMYDKPEVVNEVILAFLQKEAQSPTSRETMLAPTPTWPQDCSVSDLQITLQILDKT